MRGMKIIFAKANWEVAHLPVGEFCARAAAAGFAATDFYLPARTESVSEIIRAHRAAGLAMIGHITTDGATPVEHRASLRARYEAALRAEPLFVNSHSGKDFHSEAENVALFELGQELAAKYGVPLRHETHRGRALFCAPKAVNFLGSVPGLELTADFSHWVCVHESDLSDQRAAVEQAIAAAWHVHARVGFDQGPQVSDPRNPAHLVWRKRFLGWWRAIIAQRQAAGAKYLTITPEFGPPPYMPLAGAEAQPVGDAWEYNVWMLNWLQRELASA
jgi:sugar phosphate isomerase/epimerase